MLAPAALLITWAGGWLYGLLLAVGFAGVMWEWAPMCRFRPLPLLLGLAYAVAAMAALWYLRALSLRVVFVVFIVVWCSDIGAYAAGRFIGGRRLAPLISPGKTWSGAVGGLVAAMAGGFIASGLQPAALLPTAVFGVASQLGDLGESALKRRYDVKDSGRLIPGHGGLLDRIDGLMAAALVAALWFLVAIDVWGMPG